MDKKMKEKCKFVSNIRYQNIEPCIRGEIQVKYSWNRQIKTCVMQLARYYQQKIQG